MRKYKSKNKYKLIKSDDNDIKNDLKKINIGIQLLRTICSFLIVVCHFYNFDRYHNRIILGKNRYYIITFFYLSFYFAYNTLASRNIQKIKDRFRRILVPYIGWPLILYLYDKFNHYKSVAEKNSTDYNTLKDAYVMQQVELDTHREASKYGRLKRFLKR